MTAPPRKIDLATAIKNILDTENLMGHPTVLSRAAIGR